MNRISKLRHFIRYYQKAKTKYTVHSPFVFRFITEVLEDEREYYAFRDLKRRRYNFLNSQKSIQVLDLGAGSGHFNTTQRKISKIARVALTPEGWAKLLFRLIKTYEPKTVLELGTSLGLSSLYQTLPSSKIKTITLEGCPQTAAEARKLFSYFPKADISLIEGPFQKTLPKAIAGMGKIDYAFIDGHHAFQPTINYFDQILPYTGPESIIILDDIYWSEGMMEAWENIRNRPEVKLSIDLYKFGILFFSESILERQHFTLIKSRYKPFQAGFFHTKNEQ